MVRQINWSGYTWNVIKGSWIGNNWSDSTDNVFVDNQGNLHLKIVNRNGIWYSSEVVMANPVGYGTYTAVIASDVSVLDKNVVAADFYYNNSNTDEIDVEFSRWGTNTLPANVEYTVWQTESTSTSSPHVTLNTTTNITNIFNWKSNGNIDFATKDSNGNILASWSYTGTYHLKTGGGLELNLWLYNGKPPSNGLAQEIIFSSFNYSPSTSVIGSIMVSPTSANINIGNTQQLISVCKDQNNNTMTCPMLTWSSSNTSIATVSSSGVVKGIAKGTTNISCSYGTIISNVCNVTVIDISSLTIIQISLSLKIGAVNQLAVKCLDQNNSAISCPMLTWSSSNTSIATVSSSGVVKGIANGTANITAFYGTIVSNIFMITVA